MTRKQTRSVLLLCLLFLLAGTAIWYFFLYEPEEAAIRRTLFTAQELVAKTGNKTPILEAADFRGLQKLMEENITVSGGNKYASGDFRTDDLLRMFIQGRRFLQTLSADLYEVKIRIHEDGLSAEVTFNLVLTGRDSKNETFREFFDGKANLTKRGRGDWILHAISFEPVVRQHNS